MISAGLKSLTEAGELTNLSTEIFKNFYLIIKNANAIRSYDRQTQTRGSRGPTDQRHRSLWKNGPLRKDLNARGDVQNKDHVGGRQDT